MEALPKGAKATFTEQRFSKSCHRYDVIDVLAESAPSPAISRSVLSIDDLERHSQLQRSCPSMRLVKLDWDSSEDEKFNTSETHILGLFEIHQLDQYLLDMVSTDWKGFHRLDNARNIGKEHTPHLLSEL